MVTSPLERLAGPAGPLRREPPDANEYEGLLRSARVRLNDAQNTANSLESRFDLAYGAAHAMCLAALRRAGYRSAQRYVVFQAVPHTLGLGPEVWRVLATCHEIRNRAEYEGEADVDVRLVGDLVSACRRVASALDALGPP